MVRLQVPQVVEWALHKLDLAVHADKPAGQYSGGNRRKLSAAIALLGTPRLLLLVSARELTTAGLSASCWCHALTSSPPVLHPVLPRTSPPPEWTPVPASSCGR